MDTTSRFTVIEKQDGTCVGTVATQTRAYRQDLYEPNAFAPLRQNNDAKPYTTGAAYFEDVSKAMKAAQKSIFITSWQVNWDVELTPGERLIDVLKQALKNSPGLRIYVLPWLAPIVGGLNTGHHETMLAIFQLNAGESELRALCCPAATQNDYTGEESTFFAHHQKLVVIDNKVAFLGGIDLAYGRKDDEKFSLNHHGRRCNELYNPCVPPLGEADGSPALTFSDLLAATLGAERWNAGGDTNDAGLIKLLRDNLERAERTALESVAIATNGVQTTLRTAKQLVGQQVVVVTQAAKNTLNAGADATVTAAHAVSRQCAALQVPDLYGAVQAYKISPEANSKLPEDVRRASEERQAQVGAFLAPLVRLEEVVVTSTLEGAERTARALYNTGVEAQAQLARGAQATAAGARQACLAIGPAVELGVDTQRKALRQGIDATRAAVQSADHAVTDAAAQAQAKINAWQRALVDEVNVLRQRSNEAMAALAADLSERAGAAAERAVTRIAQNDEQAAKVVQGLIDTFKGFLKTLYLAQLALSWKDAKAHPALFAADAHGKKIKAAPAGGTVLGPTQPRQPWQDVQVRIEGPAVYDLAMNFIDRWNATQMSYLEPLQPRGSDQADLRAAAAAIRKAVDPLGILTEPLRDAAEAQARAARAELYRLAKKAVMIDGALKPAAPAERGGAPTGVAVRVLRSAPRKLLAQEARASGKKTAPGEAQHEIQTQMELLIRHASYFVYIETQFFQSAFGEPSIEAFGDQGQRLWSGPMQYVMRDRGNRILAHAMGIGGNDQLLPHNPIAQALAERIAQAVRRDRQFHVYLVLPVHPEGRLDDIAILGQIHWTMQSLVFADRSLVNRVRRAIAARPLCKNIYSDAEWEAALRKAGEPAADGRPRYESVSEADWSKYLTLLNLRTCEVVGGAVRTEQVYVHSKLLIVDDMHVVVGSANINDRSLNGGRDSELAVMLMDTNKERKPMRDAVIHVNPLARKLRVDLWKKHLALAGGGNGIVQPARELEKLIEWPAAAQTIKAIQTLAKNNAALYNKAFGFVPWSDDREDRRSGASIWPTCPPLTEKERFTLAQDQQHKEKLERAQRFASKMPFHESFWQLRGGAAPAGIKGYFTRLPTYWTSGENNHPDPISAMLLTQHGSAETNVG